MPRFDATGEALAGSAFQKARECMLSKARALWNELDKSDAQRYELDKSDAPRYELTA